MNQTQTGQLTRVQSGSQGSYQTHLFSQLRKEGEKQQKREDGAESN